MGAEKSVRHWLVTLEEVSWMCETQDSLSVIRNVMRKFVVEGGWVQKRVFDIGWSDEKKCRGCTKPEIHCPSSAM